MSSPFSASMRSLANDRSRPSILALLAAAFLLAGWSTWFIFARLSVFELSEKARLEVDNEVHSVASPVEGRVVGGALEVGSEVKAGDVLLEIESSAERLLLTEAQAQIATLAPQLLSLRAETSSEEHSRHNQNLSMGVAMDEARKQVEQADLTTHLAEDNVQRMSHLYDMGLVSDFEVARARTDLLKDRAAAAAATLVISRLQADSHGKTSDSEVRVERLRRDIGLVEGQMRTAAATVNRLGYEVEKRRVRAPIAGRIGDIAQLQAGSVVHLGEKIASIIPEGDVKAIAYFSPKSAAGRIKPGQAAHIRLEGFPWTEYGALEGAVIRVADEPDSLNDGLIRVELTVRPDSAPALKIRHGLPGSAEIEVERTSPVALVLRSVGKRLTSSAAPGQTSDDKGKAP